MAGDTQKRGGWREVSVSVKDAAGISFNLDLGANKPNGERSLGMDLTALEHIVRATLVGAGVEICEPLELTQTTVVRDYQANVTGQQVIDSANPQGVWLPAIA